MAAKNTIAIAIATIFALTLCSGGAMAQGPTSAPEPSAVVFGPSAEAPAPADCLTNLLNMSDCLTYVTAGSNLTKPDKACCPELAGLVESSPQCLCLLLDKNATSSYGIDIDMTKALNLPNVCKVETPPISLCSGINGEAPTGSDAPMSSPGLAPEATASSPSNGGSNGASNIAASATGVASLAALAIAFLPTLFGI
ncbi:hypothetical protein CCACVL1_18397 [Corchorus capsularis]|uniref:Bifunctional inhibitor/plant lipid transfer protein/seed storage helical domain-containing protein n=1 Tax=Corchorus capsularis TaxID=210143 RepID=A0A1R3HLD0_COCAP|nr:hypothetical protein CCACVL1_18397 [Corchorus capsularis]